MHPNRKQQQEKVEVSRKADRSIGTVWDQYNRNEASAKTSSTSEVMERREKNTKINLTKVH